MVWYPLALFGVICAGITVFGFYDKAKYRAAHPEEFEKKV